MYLLEDAELTESVSPIDGFTVGKFYTNSRQYVCLVKYEEEGLVTLGQLTQDEFEILRDCGDIIEFTSAFLRGIARKWLLCSREGAKNAFSEDDLCSYWIYQDMRN